MIIITHRRLALVPILTKAPIPIIRAVIALSPLLGKRTSTRRIVRPLEVDVSSVVGARDIELADDDLLGYVGVDGERLFVDVKTLVVVGNWVAFGRGN